MGVQVPPPASSASSRLPILERRGGAPGEGTPSSRPRPIGGEDSGLFRGWTQRGRLGCRSMPRRGTRRSFLSRCLIVLLGAAGLYPGAATSAPREKPPFPPGLYVGKTSQGNPVRLRLTIAGACGGEACLSSANRRENIRIAVPCPDGSEVRTFLPMPDSVVAKNGVVHDLSMFSKNTSAPKFSRCSPSRPGESSEAKCRRRWRAKTARSAGPG